MLVYGVIYSVDCRPEWNIRLLYPPGKILNRTQAKKAFKQDTWWVTERRSDGDYSELWGSMAKHRKFVGTISEKLVSLLISDQRLDWVGCDTMGSLGAPAPDGMTLGFMPAISFSHHADEYITNAYITPYAVQADGLTPLRENGMTERDWERIKLAFIARYAESYRHCEGPFEKARRERLRQESREKAKSM